MVFANPGTDADRRRAGSRYKADRSRYHVTSCRTRYEQWCSVAVQTGSKPENCQGVLDLICKQMCVSGYIKLAVSVLGADCKNHDELINATVRVSKSAVFCQSCSNLSR